MFWHYEALCDRHFQGFPDRFPLPLGEGQGEGCYDQRVSRLADGYTYIGSNSTAGS
jgi:hypothetical protein